MKASPRKPRAAATPSQRRPGGGSTVAEPAPGAPLPPRKRIVVHGVGDDDLHPRFAGWTVACARRGKGVGPDSIGRLCLVAMADGSRRLREVGLPAAAGLVILRRYGTPGDAGELVDARAIAWAAPVIELRQPGAPLPSRRPTRKPAGRRAAS